MTQYHYKFTFVMPIYGVEKYLAETLDSVINQTLSFEDHIQIILVNDGSPDNSEEVCLQYRDKYPDNIIYIKQKNGGVSSARNRGIESAEGKYISFLDSDDLISEDTAQHVYDFFETHYKEIDVVGIKMEFFEARTGSHMLNDKFHTTRVVDIQKEYAAIQLSGGSSFVKAEAVKGKVFFDEKLFVAEDAKFLTELILDKMAYGVLAEPTYFYRKREANDSALASSQNNPKWYTHTLNNAHQALLDMANERIGYAPKYLQYLIMYDIQWRLKQSNIPTVLTKDEIDEYKARVIELTAAIDDDVILEQKHINAVYKAYILHQKIGVVNPALYKKLHGSDTPWVLYDFIEVDGNTNTLTLEGRVNTYSPFSPELTISVAGKDYEAEQKLRPNDDTTFLGKKISQQYAFKVKIPITKNSFEVTAHLTVQGSKSTLLVGTQRFTGLNPTIGRAYAVKGGYIVAKTKNSIVFEVHTMKIHLKKEIAYQLALLKQRKLRPIAIRWMYYMSAVFLRNARIWLISDRTTEGGDNGEALFRYMMKSGYSEDIKPYFSVFKTSPDYKKLQKIGPVIDRASLKYKLLFLHADKVVSSHADDFIINPFGTHVKDICDLYTFDYVFLQHGVTKDDISKWLNKYNKNIRLFIAAAKPEYEWLLDDRFGYSKDEVKLTGFPRFDLLENKPADKIIVAPTWRRGLLRTKNSEGVQSYDPQFKETEYFSFYSKLISDKRILDSLERYDMTLDFYLHPSFSVQVKDFKSANRVQIKTPPYDYAHAFQEGAALVTDYSSVAFDFAYLQKPVMYTQFDKEDFFKGHLYTKGYFSYESNGFGPVCLDFDHAVSELLDLIKNPVTDSQYQDRINEFYTYTDGNNAKRVYGAITALD